MSETIMRMAIAPYVDNPGHTDTEYGRIPHGRVLAIALPLRRKLTTNVQSPLKPSPIKRVKIPLATSQATAIYNYWRLYGDKPQQRNCHSFAHAAAGLNDVNHPSKNLLLVPRLVVDERDNHILQGDELQNLPPGAAYAVVDGQNHNSEHSVFALAVGGLILDVNSIGGRLRTNGAAQIVERRGGIGLVQLNHPSPALGTRYWYDYSFTPGNDHANHVGL